MTVLKFKCILLVGIALVLFGCQSKKDERQSGEAKEAVPPIVALCEGIDYSDTATLHSENMMARYMKDIVRMMAQSDSAATAVALNVFFEGLDGDPVSMRYASQFAYRFLGNPNSPVRDETLYIRFLASLLESSGLPDDVKAKDEDRLHRAMLNRPGTRANDFHFIDRNGKEGTLHSFDAPQTMLVFYDPECPHCPEVLEKIAKDRKVNAAIDAGALKVIAVYTEGKRDMWERRKDELPQRWTVACDLSEIVEEEIYDIPAMPTVYLLDVDKRVLVKDMLW